MPPTLQRSSQTVPRRAMIFAAAPSTPPLVALTLDDGPSPTFTPMALQIARNERIPLTFFVVGQEAVKRPLLLQAEAAAGHAIENHTWHHPLYTVGPARGLWEVTQTSAYILAATGHLPTLLRPPGGMMDTGVAAAGRAQSMNLVLWDATGPDRAVSASVITRDILSLVRPGSIILLHDGGGNRYQDMLAMPRIIHALKARGYRFVTVPTLLCQHAVSRSVPAPFTRPALTPSFDPADPLPLRGREAPTEPLERWRGWLQSWGDKLRQWLPAWPH